MSRSHRVARAMVTLALLWGTIASAAESSGKRVVLHASGTDAEVEALARSLRELLSRTGTSLVLVAGDGSGGNDGDATAVVRVAFGTNAETQLVIVDGRTGRETRRAISSTPELRVEAAAHVIQFAVEDLLVPPSPPSPPPSPPAPPVPPSPPAPPQEEPTKPETKTTGQVFSSSEFGFDVGAQFGARSFGGGAGSVLGGGISLEATRGRGNGRLGVLTMGQIHAPMDVSHTLLSVQATVLSLRVLPTLQILGGRSWALQAGAGGGADVWFGSSSSSDLPSSRLFRETRGTPIASAMLATHVAVAKSADLEVMGLLDVDLAPYRFVADNRGQHETLFLAQRVRPALLIGFTFALAGLEPYPKRGEMSP